MIVSDVQAALAALGELGMSTTAKICSVKRMLDELPVEHRDAMASALLAPGKSHVGIRRILLEIGYDIPADTIGRHRAGICKCPKP